MVRTDILEVVLRLVARPLLNHVLDHRHLSSRDIFVALFDQFRSLIAILVRLALADIKNIDLLPMHVHCCGSSLGQISRHYRLSLIDI